jgi:hypothetical protein
LKNVTLDPARGLENHAVAADGPLHTAAHKNFFGDQGPAGTGPLVYGNADGMDVALDLAFDLNVTFGFNIACGGLQTSQGHAAAWTDL